MLLNDCSSDYQSNQLSANFSFEDHPSCLPGINTLTHLKSVLTPTGVVFGSGISLNSNESWRNGFESPLYNKQNDFGGNPLSLSSNGAWINGIESPLYGSPKNTLGNGPNMVDSPFWKLSGNVDPGLSTTQSIVDKILIEMNFQKYISTFQKENIVDLETLLKLKEGDFKEMSVTIGDRVNLIEKINDLKLKKENAIAMNLYQEKEIKNQLSSTKTNNAEKSPTKKTFAQQEHNANELKKNYGIYL